MRNLGPSKALTTRYLDFWMLGGASVALWALMYSLQELRQRSWAVDHHFLGAASVSASLALVVNYPHFMASYKLAYQKGRGFILKYWFQLILVPIALLVLFAAAWALYDLPTQNNVLILGMNRVFAALHLRTRVGLHPEMGAEMLGAAVLFMFMTVGWHYTKQIYGCMMVYASFDGYPLDRRQRLSLKWNLFGIWWLSFLTANVGEGPIDYFQFQYASLALPHVLPVLTRIFLGASFVFVFYDVFVRNFRQAGRWPSLNFIVPYASMYVWWLPSLFQNEFYFYAVPLFHSLQYLPFVGKMEYLRLKERAPEAMPLRGTLVAAGLMAAGFLAFEFVPNSFDTLLRTKDVMRVWFFFISAQVFINVHHYFIDNVLWRFDDGDVKRYLLK